MTSKSISVLSLGAGVQSTTLLLMACHGELDEQPVEAIFADTGAEPAVVYRHIDWLESISTIPIRRVQQGDLEADALAKKDAFVAIPFYVRDAAGRASMIRRQCTNQYKIRPIRRRIRDLLAVHGATTARLLMGITLDEATRMRDADVRYLEHSYPLVDKRMTRHDCLLWLERHGYPRPPKSACYFCPFMDNARWRDMQRNQPDEWRRAVTFDEAMRTLPRIEGEAFIHRKVIPLREVDLSTPEDHGQLSLFDAECEGMCGV